MLEQRGNLWSLVEAGDALVITTNGSVNRWGSAVMGRGIAREAAERIPEIKLMLGKALADGNRTRLLRIKQPLPYAVIAFPVKSRWFEDAKPALIARSAHELVALETTHMHRRIWMPRPGCGNGHLDWADIGPMLADILDDRFIAVTQ